LQHIAIGSVLLRSEVISPFWFLSVHWHQCYGKLKWVSPVIKPVSSAWNYYFCRHMSVFKYNKKQW